ncbi:hypothetical protein J2X63_001253 [Agromyces sp. 3263]|uniref:PxKF domain-containing protein n=1 Tax=Agromyces sp. 3263 TaxID=2817750 RepID=UPI0028649FEA|nr:PxKF domain-containing protein [Agromyces sp. 3263]MDR6905567.1 hypothetical protein [Agromyces sp. 3263]
MKRWQSTLAGAATAAALIVGGGGIAYADNLVVVDSLQADVSSISLGSIACGTPASASVDLRMKRNGSDEGKNAFADSAVVTLSASTTEAALSAGGGQLVLPSNWEALGNNVLSAAVKSTISVTSNVAGPHSGTVTYSAAGLNTDGNTITRTDSVGVTWTTLSCGVPTPVDTIAPVVVLTCPGGLVERGSNAVATWVASDTGGSGLAGASSGTLALDTSIYGARTALAVAGLVKDLADNPSAEASCDYFVTEHTPPVVVLTCPTDDVLLGSVAEATWVATDEAGGSGLATGASGTVPLNTDAYGPATAVAPAGTAVDNAGNASVAVECDYFVTEHTPPVVDLVCPATPLLLGSVAEATWTAYDPTPGSGIADGYPTSGSIVLDTSGVGSRTATVAAGTVQDNAGNTSLAVECDYSVVYDFAGFFRPVDMGGVVNSVKAGSAVPIKFSLHGNQGLDIIAAGSPTLTLTACTAGASVDAIEETVTAGGSTLTYDAVAGQYVYVWKTVKTWAGKCGTFALTLDDGTTHTAKFTFTK